MEGVFVNFRSRVELSNMSVTWLRRFKPCDISEAMEAAKRTGDAGYEFALESLGLK